MTLSTHQPRRTGLPNALREAMQARIQGKIDLPLFPDTAARVMLASKDPDADVENGSQLITYDQALAVHVLRVANSAAYAPRHAVVTLHQAINRLGMTTVCGIAVALSLKGHVFSVPGYQTRLRELWLHSAACAVFAKEVATLRCMKSDMAFLCGLLHDIGMPLAMQMFSDLMKKQGETKLMRSHLEEVMEELHRQIGELAVQKWSLDAPVAAAVRYHHDPCSASSHRDEVLITALADELAYWALDQSKSKDDFRTDLREPLQLSEDALSRLLGRRGHVIAVTEAFL